MVQIVLIWFLNWSFESLQSWNVAKQHLFVWNVCGVSVNVPADLPNDMKMCIFSKVAKTKQDPPAFLACEQWPNQPCGDVLGCVQVRVVDPGQTVSIIVCGGKLWLDLPAVGVASSGGNRIVHLQQV